MSDSAVCHTFVYKYPVLSSKLLSTMQVSNNGKTKETAALWDTGATVTCVSMELARELFPSIRDANYTTEARMADLIGPLHGPGKRKKKQR